MFMSNISSYIVIYNWNGHNVTSLVDQNVLKSFLASLFKNGNLQEACLLYPTVDQQKEKSKSITSRLGYKFQEMLVVI